MANGAAAPGESRAEAVGGEASPGGAGLWRRFAGGFPLSQGPKGLLRRRRRRSSSFVVESVGAGVLTKHPL